MKTSLYLPFVNLQINDEMGEKILYENLVQSGPAYKLVVHESPSWLEIKDNMPDSEMIEVLSEKKAQEYKDAVSRFFSPITETSPTCLINGKIEFTENLTMDLRRALSYILIAHDHKARIYEDDILELELNLSDILIRSGVFAEDAVKRVELVENLIKGYKKDIIETISVNKDPRIFHDLMDLLDEQEIKALSEGNYLFGFIGVEKDVLKRDVNQKITNVIKNKYLPYLSGGAALALSYILSLRDLEGVLALLAGLGTEILSGYDFREYAPPVQDPQLFRLGKSPSGVFSYQPFNYDFKIAITKLPRN